MLEQQKAYVLRMVEERGVRLVRLWFTDIVGSLKSFAISPAELEGALDDGMTFDGSSIDGFSRIQESDVLAMPDANTFEVLPWGDPKATEARVFCDIHNLDGSPFEGDPRQVLRRNLQRARSLGFTFFVAPDMEFFYFAPPERGSRPVPLDEGGFFDLTTTDVAGSLRKQTIRTLETMSIPVEYSFHEDAPSQHEIDLRHTDALTMADSVMTFRLVVKEVAAANGVHATFMPKPLEGVQGSGMHAHLSLFTGDENAFYSDDDALQPVASGEAVHGRPAPARRRDLRHHQPDRQQLQAARARLRGAGAHLVGEEQPQRPDPGADPEAGQPLRHPHRVPLARPRVQSVSRVLRAAGGRIEGHRGGLRAAAEADANLFEMSDDDLAKLGIEQLPPSLSDALKAMERSPLVAEALGEHIFEWFLRNKRSEWRAYKTHVTMFEHDRYLRSL